MNNYLKTLTLAILILITESISYAGSYLALEHASTAYRPFPAWQDPQDQGSSSSQMLTPAGSELLMPK